MCAERSGYLPQPKYAPSMNMCVDVQEQKKFEHNNKAASLYVVEPLKNWKNNNLTFVAVVIWNETNLRNLCIVWDFSVL